MCGNLTTSNPVPRILLNQLLDLKDEIEWFISVSDNIEFKNISTLLRRCELSAQQIRSYLEYSSLKLPEKYKVRNAEELPSPVRVDFSGNTLRIETPLTFNRGIPDSYVLADSVRKVLQKYQKDFNKPLFWKLKPPLMILIKRKAQKYTSRFRDNDNMETGRIINTMMTELGLSDNCMLVTDVLSSFQLVSSPEDEGVEFLVFPKSEVRNHYDDLFSVVANLKTDQSPFQRTLSGSMGI